MSDTLPTGEELRVLILVHILGWRREGDDSWCSPEHQTTSEHVTDWEDGYYDDWNNKGAHPCLVSPKGDKYYLCPCRDRGNGLAELPDYLTGDGMLIVVEKMKERGFNHYELLYRGWDELPWFSAFSTDEQENRNEYGGFDDADDAPTATAYAALKALGVI